MTIFTHKCEWCGALYGCACRKQHFNKPPAFDCGRCDKTEVVNTDTLPRAPYPVGAMGGDYKQMPNSSRGKR